MVLQLSVLAHAIAGQCQRTEGRKPNVWGTHRLLTAGHRSMLTSWWSGPVRVRNFLDGHHTAHPRSSIIAFQACSNLQLYGGLCIHRHAIEGGQPAPPHIICRSQSDHSCALPGDCLLALESQPHMQP